MKLPILVSAVPRGLSRVPRSVALVGPVEPAHAIIPVDSAGGGAGFVAGTPDTYDPPGTPNARGNVKNFKIDGKAGSSAFVHCACRPPDDPNPTDLYFTICQPGQRCTWVSAAGVNQCVCTT